MQSVQFAGPGRAARIVREAVILIKTTAINSHPDKKTQQRSVLLSR
jgi:hypothetical protein